MTPKLPEPHRALPNAPADNGDSEPRVAPTYASHHEALRTPEKLRRPPGPDGPCRSALDAPGVTASSTMIVDPAGFVDSMFATPQVRHASVASIGVLPALYPAPRAAPVRMYHTRRRGPRPGTCTWPPTLPHGSSLTSSTAGRGSRHSAHPRTPAPRPKRGGPRPSPRTPRWLRHSSRRCGMWLALRHTKAL